MAATKVYCTLIGCGLDLPDERLQHEETLNHFVLVVKNLIAQVASLDINLPGQAEANKNMLLHFNEALKRFEDEAARRRAGILPLTPKQLESYRRCSGRKSKAPARFY